MCAPTWFSDSAIVQFQAVRRAEIHFSWHLNMFCSGVSYAVGDSDECPNIIVFGLKYGCEAMAIDTPSEVSVSLLSVLHLYVGLFLMHNIEKSLCTIEETLSRSEFWFQEQTVISSSSSESKPDDAVPYVQFCLFEPKNFSSYSLLAEDRLSLAANHSSQPCQFAMVGLPCYESYFLAGPSDLVMVTPYCAEDTIRWRVENGLMEEAWELACDKHAELEGTKWNSRSIGRAMIEHLISTGKPRQAAARMAEVCGSVSTEWEWAISAFERSRLCTLIAEFLPTSNPQLEPECYETALQAALYNDVDLFKRLVQQWSPDLYRTGFITGLTLKRIQEIVSSQLESNRSSQSVCFDVEIVVYCTFSPSTGIFQDEIHLYQALAHLYLHERKFDSALKIYLSLKDPQIFAVIDKYQLFEQVKDQVSELMRINTDRALRLLLDNEDNVPASLVMAKIARQPKLQLAYLTKLLNKNEGAEYADQAVRLYADHDRKKLIPFLRKNENYHIRKALEICRQKNFVEEMILLFGKSGKHAEALDLVIKKYNQLDKAIEYCQEHDDTDLWARLIEEVIETPAHIAYLLNHAGSSIDPLHVIEKVMSSLHHGLLTIPPTMPVPGLRDALVKVLRDYAAKVALQCGCQEATRGDVRELLTQHLQTQTLPVYYTLESHCSVCGKRLVMSDPRGAELRMFGCGHIAHLSCCLEDGYETDTSVDAARFTRGATVYTLFEIFLFRKYSISITQQFSCFENI
ncbi:unnamed protein product [Cylicostephanus goldi]|uniref:Vacuolar sorting protein 39/Transforming growth factor beta receptor-associated domain-containing protein n=1 Tax=Cylicostephanus goldi TaxID=71465 RepID=A0A3P6Q5E0_CYLGO|nr:unnamed protein product [Cylicostephanus goldi]